MAQKYKPTVSKWEKHLEQYLVHELHKLSIFDVQFNTRRLLKKQKEVDVFIPSQRIAFEMNGVPYHCSGLVDSPKSEDYHKQKVVEALRKKVKLYFLWTYTSPDLNKKLISQIVGSAPIRTARPLKCEEITVQAAMDFLKTHHPQGYIPVKGSRYFALKEPNNFYIAVASFYKKREYEYELAQYAQLSSIAFGNYFMPFVRYLFNSMADAKIIWATFCRDFYPTPDDCPVERGEDTPVFNEAPRQYYVSLKSQKLHDLRNTAKNSLESLSEYSHEKSVEEIMKERGLVRLYDSGGWTFLFRRDKKSPQ